MKKALALPMDVRIMQWTSGVMFAIAFLMCIASGIGSVFFNFASTIRGLFGPRHTASVAAATTGAGFAAATVPVATRKNRQYCLGKSQAIGRMWTRCGDFA